MPMNNKIKNRSFLGDRAVAAATTPAPLPASEPDEAQQGSGIIPGDRPEFPLPTLNDKHSFLATPRGIDRPRTPPELSFEDSRALLTRLTGLQPWQLEAFPDELPPLPLSRPSSPLRSPETSRPPPQVRPRRLSSTAVPIRFRKPPLSPSTQRELALEPEKRSVSPGTSPVRSRHSKAHSAEFRTSREIRPLYLLERNRKSGEIDEVLPALPSSASPSRASSSTDTDAEYESALESPRPSDNVTPDDLSFDPLHAVSDLIAGRPGPELQHPELVGREIEEVDGSGQVTPKASDFTSSTPAASVGPSRDVLAAALEDVKAKRSSSRPASPLAPSAPLDDTKMRDVSTTRSGKSSPTNSSSRLQTAAFGAAIGGLTAAAFRNRTPSPFEVLTGGRRLSEERKIETESAPVSSEPDEMEIDRDKKGKGKAQRDMSVSEPSVAAPPQKVSEPKQVPTFVDNEDDWAKNKSESIVTDDATLVGESTSGPSASKEIQTEKILESTAPQAAQPVDVLRATFGSGDKSSDEPTSTSAASPADLEKALADIKPEQEPVQTIAEDVASSTPKGKKKKNKKGKRGSQQAEAEPPSLPIEPAQEDKIIPEPETQKETMEREILEPSFPSASQEEKKVDVMDFLEKDDQDAAPESERSIPSVVEPAAPVADIPAVEVKVLEQSESAAPSDVKELEQPKFAATETPAAEPERPTSGWGSGLWGALGWGKKRATSPAPAPAAAPVVEMKKKKETEVPPVLVAPSESKQPEIETEVKTAKPEPAQEVAVVSDEVPMPEATTAPTFVVPQTAYFADGGKPHFTFPQPLTKVTEDSARELTEDVIVKKGLDAVLAASSEPTSEVYQEAKQTYATAPPPTAFFTDNGKPHFTFPQPSVKKVEEVSQAPSDIIATEKAQVETPSELPVASEYVSRELTPRDFTPPTPFFTDNGKPHFTFPQPSTKSAEAITPGPESILAAEVIAPVEPTESSMSKKKKVKKDKKKRESVVAPEPESAASEPPNTTAGPSQAPDVGVHDQQVQQRSEDLVTAPPAADDAAVLLRDTQRNIVPVDVTLPENAKPTEKDVVPEPQVENAGKTVELPQEAAPADTVPSTPAEEDAAQSSSKKKNKKAKKAKRESVQLSTVEDSETSTPVVERSLDFSSTAPSEVKPDAGIDVPLPMETVTEKDELAEPIVEPAEEAPVSTQPKLEIAVQDVTIQPIERTESVRTLVEPASAERDIPETAPSVTEEELAATPKKKGKKSKAKSGTQTPEVQAEPIVEPSTSTAELAEPSRDVVEMSKEPTEPTQLSEPTTSVVAPPLEQTKSLEVEPTPVEQQPREDISATTEPSAEAGEATLVSKKEKKKKKGKKAKGTETPVEETVLPEVPTTIDKLVEPSVQPENIGLPDELDGELDAPVEETTVQPPVEPETPVQADTKEIALSTEDTSAAPRPDIPSEPVSRDITDLTTDNSTVPEPAPIEESVPTPVVIQPTDTAEADDLTSTPSKKDKKKKKAKKNKAVDESEPSTPVTEVQRELEASIESVQPEPTVETDVAKPEQPLEGVTQPIPTPEVATVAEERPIEALTEPEHARDLPAIISEEPIQAPATDVVGEAATESKKAKKKKGKKGKSVDIEPSAADLPKETVESETVIEPPVVEKAIEAEPVPLLEEPQETPLPLETPKEVVAGPVEVVKETEDKPTPVLAESTRNVEEPVIEEEAAASKKSKKKKAKKGKSFDTEPSTPNSEEPPVLVKDFLEPAPTEKSDAILEVQEQAPSNKEAMPAPVSAVVDDGTPSAVEKPVQDTAVSSAPEPTVEPTVGPHIEPTVEPTVETTIEPAVEAEGAELASKKSKKKKAKKAKSTDITEPSTPTTEEPSVQFEAPSEPVAVEKSSDEVAQPPIDELIPEATTVPTVDESLSRTVSKAENTDVPTERASKDAVEPPMPLEPAAEEAVVESTPKKAKKKKGKKATADEEKEPETVTEAVKDAPIVEPSPEAAQVEETVHPPEPLVADAPVESISLADDTLPTPLTEEPIERELATEMGQLSEPVDFEVPMETPSAEFEALPEVPLSTERSEPQIEEPENDDATSTSKKTKKKKSKKSKSISEPQTPVTEVESFIAATTETPEAQASPAPVESTTTTEEVALPEIETAKPTETQDVEQTLIEPIQPTEELSRDNDPSVTVADQPAEPVGESTTDAPLSKKDKKKAKKGKRVSIVEDTPPAPAAPVEEVTRELGSEEHATEVPQPQPEIATISEPVSPKSMPVSTTQQEDVVPTTLDDSNLAEPTSIGETIAPADSEGASTEQMEKKTVEPEPTLVVEEDATSSKKGKKKAKKDKRKSVTESEPSTPLETPTQELERAPLDKETFAIPAVVAESKEDAVNTAVGLEPATATPMPEENTSVVTKVKQEEQQPSVEPVLAEEPQQPEQSAEPEQSSLSKKDKKKAKKSKRVSIAEPESTPATPTEEKEVSLEDQPLPVAQLPEPAQDEAVSSSIEVQPVIIETIEEQKVVLADVEAPLVPATAEEDQQAQQTPEEESSAISKKEKKKAKKAKRVSIAEPESEVATPSEEKKELELPVEAPVAPTSAATEEATPAVTPVEELISRGLPVGDSAPVAPAVEESSLPQTPAEEPTAAPVEEEAPTSVSKKDKNKAKKAKRGSVAESGTTTPIETSVEENAQDLLDVQEPQSAPAVEEQILETPATEEPVLVAPPADDLQKAVDAEATATSSKKDKKKSKKAKRGSIAETEPSEPSIPIEASTPEVVDAKAEDRPANTASDVNESVIVAPVGPQPAVALTESAAPESTEQVPEQTKDVLAEDQPLTTPPVVEEPIVAVPEVSQIDMPFTATEETPKDIVQEDAPSASTLKKDKKKTKKSKRGSIAEPELSEPSAPVEQVPEQTKDVSVEEQQPVAPVITEEPVIVSPIVKEEISQPSLDQEALLPATFDESKEPSQAFPPTEPLSSEAVSETAAAPVEQTKDDEAEPAEWANLSKAQKKKLKKAKRASVAESEPSQPVTPAEELTKELRIEDVQPMAETADLKEPIVAPVVDESTVIAEQPEASSIVQEPVEAVEEPVVKSKKDKKKAKKSKASSVIEGELSQPATPIEEVSRELAPSFKRPVVPDAHEIARVQKSAEGQSVTATPVEEPQTKPIVEAPIEPTPAVEEIADATLSKKDKKKAKKSKRASGIEDQTSLPATPVEEVTKELGIDDQPSTSAATEQPTTEEPPAAHDTPPPDQATEEAPAAATFIEPVEEPTKPSKKDKKKAKKQQKESKSETVPFLALETPEEANVSDTQSSPPPSIPSETPLLLSGIPTSYPHVRDIAFVENGGESVQDESARVVDEKEMENKLDVDVEKQEEPVVEAVDEEKTKKTKTDKKGKKRASVVEDPLPEASSAVDVADTTPIEPSGNEQVRSVAEVATLDPEVVVIEQPIAQVDTTEAQLHDQQPVEEVKAAPEEKTTTMPSEPEQKKVKKHKLAALFEQKAAEDKPILPRKRTPLAKSTPETIATEPTGESSKEVKVDELVATAQLESVVSIDNTAKPNEEIALPKDIVEPGASAPTISEVVMDKPLEPSERALDPVDEQSKEPTPVSTEPVLDPESSAAAKKDKKKAKKDKKKSGTATPVEAVPDVPDAAEEPLTSNTEETSLEAAPLVDKNVPVKAEEKSQEISEVIPAQPIVTDTPRDISADLSQEKSIEVGTPSEPSTAVDDEVIATPSKKDKKKNKKAKKQSGTATPADETLPEAQPEKVEEPPVQAPEQIVDQPAVIKAAPVVEEAPALVKENIKPSASDKTIAISQEEASAVVVDRVADIPSQQEEEVQQPTASVPEEAVGPIADTDVKLSKKDKKKAKKSKKSSGIDTPMVEDVPEVEQKVEEPAMGQVEAVIPSQVMEAEPVVEQTNEALAETIPTALGKAIETPPCDEAPTVETEVATDAPEHAPATDMPVQPAEEDWSYTAPKKDEKKGKKAKKAEDVATIVEPISELPSKTAETIESTATPEKTIQDDVEAQPLQVTETDAVKAEDTNEQNLESERALDIAETDITEVAPLPAPELPAEAPIEEEAPTPSSKKDKKKAKKAKKASGAATPVTEEVAIVQPEQVQEHTADNADSVTEPIEEVPAAISRKELVVEQPREVEQESISPVVAVPAPLIDEPALPSSATKEEAQKSEEAFAEATVAEDGPAIPADITQELTIATTDANKSLVDEPPVAVTQEGFVATDTRGVERPAQDSAPTVEVEPLDKGLTPEASKKKSKKKAKKSGTATPINEDVPASEPELSRDLGIQPEPATNVKDDIMEDVQPSTAQTQPILEEQSRIEQRDTPVVSHLTDLVTTIDEQAPAPTPKKTKKKSNMSGTATPTIDDTVVPQQETTQESQDTPMLVESVDTTTSEPRYDVEVTRDVEIQEADISHATVEPELQPDPTPHLEEDIAPTSSKKSKKKAKKSDTSASIAKGVPQVAPEDVPPPVEEPIATNRDVQESTVQALDVPDAKDDTPATIEPVLAPEPELEAPIDVKAEDNGLAVSEDLAIAPELVTEDTTSTPSKKKKKNKGKKSEPQTPAIELSDPMATETRTVSEDVQQAPGSEVAEVGFQAPVPEPLVLADKVPSETRGEVIVEEKPVLTRKLSKKEKKARKSSIAMDVEAEPIAEREVPTESMVEGAQAPEIELMITEEPRQVPIIAEPEVPALTAEPIHPVEHAEKTVPTADSPVAAPMQDQISTEITQGETASTPVKGNKAKKDKKSKKQSLSLDNAEAGDVAESSPNEQARDDAKSLIEPSQETAVVRDLDSLLAASNEVTDPPALELSEAVEALLPQVLGNIEQVPERQATLDEPEIYLQPRAEENSESMPTVDIEPIEVTEVPSRKASKKTKKGKKNNDVPSEQQQPEAMVVAEPTVESIPEDLPSTAEQLDVPAPSKSSSQELQLTSTTIDLPTSDVTTEPHSQLIEPENEPLPATVETVNEATTSAQPLEDPMSIVDQTEVTTPSKKSKKDKKKGKKSSLTSGITTPIENLLFLHEQLRDARPIEPEAIVREGPSDTQPPQEVTSAPAVATIQDTPLPAREIAQEQERQTIEADELSLSRSASKKGKKKGKKAQNVPSELDNEIATTENEVLPVTAQESPKEEVEVLPIITEARREAERSPPPPSFQTTQADSESTREIVEPALDQVTQVKERQDEKEELSQPPTISSPDLKAVQDDVAEFKLRSEALDQALATQEQLDEPTSSDPTSFSDVVGKLSKKDKKKGKKAKGASLDTEPTTPAAEPEAVVETKEIVEEPRMAEIPSRKLSKKDKKKAKQSVSEVEEVAKTLPEQVVPVIETQQPLIDQSREEAKIFTETTTAEPAIQPDAPVVPVEQTQPTSLEEPVYPSEEAATMKKEASRVNDTLTREIETIVPLARTETQHTDLAASVIKAPEAQPDVPPEAESIAEGERPSVSRKLSKKDKKKDKKSASIDESTKTEQIPEVAAENVLRTEELPIESQQPDVMNQEIPVVDVKATEKEAADTMHMPVEDTSVLQQSAVESAADPEPTPAVAPEIAAEDESALPSKKSKKEKRKSKPTAESDVLPDISRAPVEGHLSQQVVEVAEPEIEPASKPEKEEKRKTKKTTPAFEAESTAPLGTERKPELPKEAVSERTETVTAPARVVDDQSTRVALIRDAEPSSSTTSLDTAEAPTLAKKPSRAQKLAALFEQGASQEGSSGQRELRKGTTGSVKDLAKQYETQSRSVTPIQLPTSEKRTVSRVTSDARLGSRSPKKDIDFAGTVAAGLKISGFDDTYVVNDSTFHKSTSPHGTHDITTDDDVAAALNSAGASKFASQGWTTPTSSPKLRPTKESESSTLPPIEVAIAATDDISFDPLDVLNDPTFSKSNTSPRALEEADPDELGSKLKMNKKSSGKKKRTSLPESPAEAVPTTLSNEPTGGSLDAQSKELPTEHDSAWPFEPKKDKKVKKDKKQASRTQDSVEYAVGETPAVEALTREPPVVETLAVDSTASESKLANPLSQAPINVAPVDQGVPKEQAPKRATGKEFDEYPFPQVPIPRDAGSRDIEKSPMVGRKETEEVEELAGSSKKKEKKSRKGKEKSEPRSEMQEVQHHNSSVDRTQDLATETHKRRSHPVTFEEDQPYEKRTHLREATPELRQATSTKTEDSASNERSSRRKTSALDVEPRDRGLSPSAEPTWSFAGVRDSAVEVDELPVQARPAPFQESTRDSGYHDAGHSPVMPGEPVHQETTSSREKKRRSKEPKTPRERAIRNSQDVENSPTLPEYPASAGATTPSPQEYATKERTSYLFDSSPSTRAYGTSPTVETVTPAHESRRAVPSTTKEMGETTRPSKSKKPHAGSRDEQVSPTKEIEHKEPYQSIFGDPKEKSTGQSSSLVTPLSKHGRTPSNNQLHTITETSPPDDSPLHKKGRAINDVGAPDRGTKSARRTESPKPFSERLKSPPPVTPTPLSRRGHWKGLSIDRIAMESSTRQRRSNDDAQPCTSASGDLRAVSRLGEASAQDANETDPNLSGLALATGAVAAIAGIADASKYDPVRGTGKGRRANQTVVAHDANRVQEAWGEVPRSPMSPSRPTRPPSVRKRQSMQLIDLQTQLDELAAQNSSLENAKARAEETLQATYHQRQIDEQLVAEAAEAQANRNLANDTNERYAQLQSEGQLVHQQWQTTQRELEQLRTQHQQLTRGVEDAVRDEIGIALDERNAEIDRLNTDLTEAKEQIKTLQKQILSAKKPSESFLTIRDEDYFDSACQQLCQHVQQWVLRFSKFSDTRPCKLSSEIAADTRLDTATRQKIDTRLDNAILDGSDVDSLLADRVKRRDVFMSVVMTMIWEYVFTRYLFGMDREQRQKLKSLEKTLSEVGEYIDCIEFRTSTNILVRTTTRRSPMREAFIQQRAQDTEAVVHEIYSTLSTLLSPPSHLQRQIQESLRNVMRLAVELSIEMRTQRAEYIMLPPLQPEYDTNGDLVAKVTFNASLMNERSGRETSNDELEGRGAIVKIVLFPLVVKKGDDFGEGEDEIVVCPAQVLVQRPRDKKVVRMLSGAMSIDRPDSRASRMTSVVPESSIMDYETGSGNVI
ncbi:hypothetical protein SNOG_02682 [Parastagonospora nodorum SN15]|uniref:Uncharacterized protein n=1 Tax=Phaeosphaeria nodorum (strain SN15 / ATCC MYA-4574 / FGSC 10173) TaxID=321614 RepID=Q0UZY2_PHANO|nr:hypothetical protein SNOG_02682 [Parastagonospora nodorum SN15]EAT89413.2 hypothetical protein SNOG_02682 [Parastagonospora nodorum SN15]